MQDFFCIVGGFLPFKIFATCVFSQLRQVSFVLSTHLLILFTYIKWGFNNQIAIIALS